MVTTERRYKVVGTRPIRHDGVDKVTGRAQYGADIRLPGMLYGRMLRSPHAHARIKRIDTSKAAALPGVKAVITAADFPPDEDEERVTNFGPFVVKFRWYRDNLMASDKVLYQGHAVAAVCATDQHIAEDALRLIKVEYELLPLVLDVRDAMLDDAPILQEGVKAPESMGQGADKPSNVNMHIHHEVGDVEAGFGEADVIIEREFETTMVHQGYIELQNGSAFWNKDDEVTIWTSTQGNFGMRDTTAKILQLPVSKVKVSPVEIGGGFGGKIHSYLEPIAALLSKKSGRPVKMYMSRTDVLQGTGPTCGTYDRIKIGAKKDGTIVAAEAYLAYEAGAYMGAPIMPGCMAVFAPYKIPHQRVDGYEVFVNKPRVSAYRAPGAPAAEYASECVIDELAEKLDMDPIELRLQNASVEGTTRADGYKFGIIGNVAVLEAAKNSPHYRSELTGENRGRGVASGFWFNIGQESGAIAAVNADGTVSLSLGSPDIGGTRVAIAMQLAETLGITAQDVKPQIVDTDSVGYTFVTGGSRTAFAGGWAAHEAALDVRRLLEERAAAIWECERADVAYGDDGVIRGPKDEDGKERSFTFKEIAAQLPDTGGRVTGRADTNKTSSGPAFATHIVDVEVDPETGKVEILRYTAVQDPGIAIHPSYVEGQVQGGAAQGIGMALNEEYFYDDEGHLLNSSLLDYRTPTALDLPMIETILAEVPNPGHPYGVRGVGEVPIIPPAPALHAAINNAIGVRMNKLPMSPRAILEKTILAEE